MAPNASRSMGGWACGYETRRLAWTGPSDRVKAFAPPAWDSGREARLWAWEVALLAALVGLTALLLSLSPPIRQL